jgi:WD40 repeat protein
LYDLTTGGAVGTYTPDLWVDSLAMSPDGERAALLMENGRVIVLDLARLADGDDETDPELFEILAHAAGSKAVAFSSSGLIATGSSLDGIRVWSPDGELLANVPTNQVDPPTFAFALGSDTLYYEDANGVVRRFEIDVDALAQLARSIVTRDFTQEECERYFPGEACPTFETS